MAVLANSELPDILKFKDTTDNDEVYFTDDSSDQDVAFVFQNNTVERFRIGTTFVQVPLQGELRLADADSSHYVALKSQATVSVNKTWIWPATDGTADQVLKTDGSGNLGWATAGSGGAPTNATYIVQTADATLTNEQALGALATGILKNTTTTGVLSIAAAGTDYYQPSGTDVAVADGGTGASNAATARTNLGAATDNLESLIWFMS